jgi:hypothetical protein
MWFVRVRMLVMAGIVGAVSAFGLVAAGLVWAGAVRHGTAAWKVMPSPHPGFRAVLFGVAATSSTDAWAVGYFTNANGPRTLVEHWNGKAWKVQPSPNRGSADNELFGVAATSSTNAWAVGHYFNGTAYRALIEHWNGKAWKIQKAPGPGSANELSGVAATSPTDAWTVGDYDKGTADRALVERWNGNAWKVQPSPNPGSSDYALFGVAAISSTSAWAAGSYVRHDAAGQHRYRTLVEHWNGRAWNVQPSPNATNPNNPRNRSFLYGVDATSATDAWAAGIQVTGTVEYGSRTLIERWNGKSWKVLPSPAVHGPYSVLNGVAATSGTNAWAVGSGNGSLIEHWNGQAWKVQASSSSAAALLGVAATSSTNAWAVGDYSKGRGYQTLIEHCC